LSEDQKDLRQPSEEDVPSEEDDNIKCLSIKLKPLTKELVEQFMKLNQSTIAWQ
jgi:hypothetical protein